MSISSPASILYDSNANPYGVSGSMSLPVGAIGQLMAGYNGTSGLIEYLSSSNGSLVVTGSLATNVVFPSIIQTWTAGTVGVSGSVSVSNQPAIQAVSGSALSGSTASAPINTMLNGGLDQNNVVRPIRLDPQGRATNQAISSSFTSVTASLINTTALQANSQRIGFMVYNEGPANLFLKYGATASTSSYSVQVGVRGFYETGFSWVGQVDAIFDRSSGGTARFTDFS